MAEKKIIGRAIQKHDTETNWLKATNFIPMQGEIIVYDKDSNYNYERIKIGDGSTLVSALPFVDDALRTSLLAEINAVDDKVDAVSALVGDTAVSTQISNAVANKSNTDHTHDDRYYTESEINTKLNAKADADHTHEISELTDLSSATVNHAATADSADEATHATTADTANAVAWANVTGKPSTYTPATHSHAISDVTNLQTTLNAKVPTSRTINGKALSANITLSASDVGADASGAANTALTNAKSYTDAEISEWVGDETVSEQISTAIANKVDKVSGKGLSTNDYTTTEKNKLAGIESGAEVNQNAFSNIAIGSTTIAADAETDTLTLVAGSNVTITPDATNDKITIAATDTVYTHPTYTAKSSGLYKVTVDSTGHVSGTAAVAKSDITALGIPAQDTTYSAATTSAAGLMSAADKKKLDGIATGATKISVDSALSSTSTNPVQNKVVNTAITNLNNLVGDTAVSEQIEAAQIVYVGPTQPTDPNIKVWINTSEEGTGVVPVLPRVTTISLAAASWGGSSAPYSQVVEINTVTSATKIDLQPTVAQIVSMQNDDIALMAENSDGVVTIYSFGGKPSADMTMQVLLTEVSYV